MSGIRIQLPKGTKIEDGRRVVPPDPTLKMPKPAQYAAKKKRTWKAAK